MQFLFPQFVWCVIYSYDRFMNISIVCMVYIYFVVKVRCHEARPICMHIKIFTVSLQWLKFADMFGIDFQDAQLHWCYLWSHRLLDKQLLTECR